MLHIRIPLSIKDINATERIKDNYHPKKFDSHTLKFVLYKLQPLVIELCPYSCDSGSYNVYSTPRQSRIIASFGDKMHMKVSIVSGIEHTRFSNAHFVL